MEASADNSDAADSPESAGDPEPAPDPVGDLHAAVREGRTDQVTQMLERDPGLAGAKRDGLSTLLLALFSGREELAHSLVERGAPVDLREAAALGAIDRLEAALARDGEEALHTAGALGWTPLHLAAFLGRTEATRRLLEHGAEPSLVSTNGEANTPLHAALAGRGEPDVIAALLEAGADPGTRAAHGVTPLHLAASRGDAASVELLVSSGAAPEPMDDGRLPSALAEERGHPEVAERLESLESATREGTSEA